MSTMSMRTLFVLITASALTAQAQTLPRLTVTREVFVDGAIGLLSSIRHVVVGSAGTVYVPDSKGQRVTTEVRVYGPDGNLRKVFGRPGSGPGDFRVIWETGVVGDSLWVNDNSLRRITLVSPEGTLIRTMPTKEEISIPKSAGLRDTKLAGGPLALYPDGGALIRGMKGGYIHMRETYGAIPYIRTSRTGAFERIVGWIPFGSDVVLSKESSTGAIGLPFPNTPVEAVATDGSGYAYVRAEINSPVPSATATVVRASGDTVFSRSIPIAAEPIPPDVMENAYAVGPPGAGTGLGETFRQKNGPKVVALIRAAPRPVFYPPLDRVNLSSSGWSLIGFRTESREREYLVLDAAGRPFGSLRLPAATTIAQFDGSVIWTIEHDRDRVPSVVRYRIALPPG
jgi:hypothetical protein